SDRAESLTTFLAPDPFLLRVDVVEAQADQLLGRVQGLTVYFQCAAEQRLANQAHSLEVDETTVTCQCPSLRPSIPASLFPPKPPKRFVRPPRRSPAHLRLPARGGAARAIRVPPALAAG